MPTEDECIQDKRFFFLHPKANSMSAFRTVEHRSLTINSLNLSCFIVSDSCICSYLETSYTFFKKETDCKARKIISNHVCKMRQFMCRKAIEQKAMTSLS